MAGASLLTLLDDIATVLDDVALLSKVAAKKSTGVLGDDLALNAEQVSGVKADRELPVVWAVAKGSFLNKLILVPSALIISAIAPVLIIIMLIIGGLFLCYEGFEKVFHKIFFDKKTQLKNKQEIEQNLTALSDQNADLVALEKDKIKGAIRTDFILSAEIVVIVLGTIQDASYTVQILVLSLLAIAITVGVYGLVAVIVKIDDLGLYLLKSSKTSKFKNLTHITGRSLLISAPLLMKVLTIIGTLAMFLVGGGILVHNFSWLHHAAEQVTGVLMYIHAALGSISGLLFDGVVGFIAGGVVLITIGLIKKGYGFFK